MIHQTFDQSSVQQMNRCTGPAPKYTLGGSQQVLKAERSGADATDREPLLLSNVDRVLAALADIRAAARFVGLQ